jgi:molybdopterin biosynthesis enzyme
LFQKPPISCTVHFRGFFLHPVRGGRIEKIYQWQKMKAGTAFIMRLSEHSLELIRVFMEAGKYLYTSFQHRPKSLKTNGAHTESTFLEAFQTKYVIS